MDGVGSNKPKPANHFLVEIHGRSGGWLALHVLVLETHESSTGNEPRSGDVVPKSEATVDGWNPAPVDMVDIPLFIGFYTSQVVQDFVHQQY